MQRTISVMVGKGSVNHNSRVFHAKNTDPDRASLNHNYCNENIKTVYHELFDEALERFNAKQTRTDRVIKDYYEKIRSGKQEKPFHEVILQIGNFKDMNAQSDEGRLAEKVLDEYMQRFPERNPYLRVFSAHLHMDEATPHLHIDFVPFTTGSKRGLDTRVSLKQALAALGFKGGTRGDTEWNQWVLSEKQQLAAVMERHGIEWEHKGAHEKHQTDWDYKKQERAKEVAQLEVEISNSKVEVGELSKRIADLTDCETAITKISETFETDPQYQLPEPTALMSAKSYKTKYVEPLINRLKRFVKSVLVRYFELKNEFGKWQKANHSLAVERDTLRNRVGNLQEKNSQLEDTVKDYRLLRKAIGSKQVDEILQQARAAEQSKKRDKRFRNNNYER